MEKEETVAVDSSALIALSREDLRAAGLIRQLRRCGAALIVPAPVLAETLRGGNRDAAMYRILRMLDDEVATSPHAGRSAGTMIGGAQARSHLVVDALILATALEHGATAVVTQDVSDFKALAPPGFTVMSL